MHKMIKNEKGFTGMDVVISVIVLFIFVSLIATLMYKYKSSSKEVDLKSEATYIAIDEIEKVKNNGFEKYDTLNVDSTTDEDGNSLKNQPTQTKGFYKTIKVEDYTDIEGNEDKTPNLVKRVTVEISYVFKGNTQTVELSTVLNKED